MKEFKINIQDREIIILQDDDGCFIKPEIVIELEKQGTATKPAHEPICMARKPLSEKTVAENVLKWGTGGINIDESRVGYKGEHDKNSAIPQGRITTKVGEFAGRTQGGGKDVELNREEWKEKMKGRFPANLIHDNSEEVRECFPETKKGSISGYNFEKGNQDNPSRNVTNIKSGVHFGDSGNASRFFYTAKASTEERNRGLQSLPDTKRIDYGGFHSEKGLITNNRNPENRKPMKNSHPTVKPIDLMSYLVKLITPKNGIVLDPFIGSGTTAIACKQLGYQYIGFEKEKEYVEIAIKRLEATSEPIKLDKKSLLDSWF